MKFITLVLIFVILDLANTLIGLILTRFESTHRAGVRLLAMSFFATGLAPHICLDKGTEKCGNCGNWTCPIFTEKRKPKAEVEK